jgi:hypothetical protein
MNLEIIYAKDCVTKSKVKIWKGNLRINIEPIFISEWHLCEKCFIDIKGAIRHII